MNRDVVLLLVGAAIGVPLSILANLAAVPIQEWLGRQGGARVARRRSKVLAEYNLVKRYVHEPQLLQTLLLRSGLQAVTVAGIGAVDTVLAVVLPTIGIQFLEPLALIAGIAAIFLFLTSVNIARRALRIYDRTQNFDAFQRSVAEATGVDLTAL